MFPEYVFNFCKKLCAFNTSTPYYIESFVLIDFNANAFSNIIFIHEYSLLISAFKFELLFQSLPDYQPLPLSFQ